MSVMEFAIVFCVGVVLACGVAFINWTFENAKRQGRIERLEDFLRETVEDVEKLKKRDAKPD